MTGRDLEALRGGRESLTGGWEAFPDVQVWTEGLTGGREAFTDVREWSGVFFECPIVVGRPSRVVWSPSRVSGSGREASRVVGRPSQMSGSG